MSDFTIRGLDHVTITAPEELETEVLELYGTFLGLKRLDKPEGTALARCVVRGR